jgi:hypothetical protein
MSKRKKGGQTYNWRQRRLLVRRAVFCAACAKHDIAGKKTLSSSVISSGSRRSAARA